MIHLKYVQITPITSKTVRGVGSSTPTSLNKNFYLGIEFALTILSSVFMVKFSVQSVIKDLI
jgi:hypothetical protein